MSLGQILSKDILVVYFITITNKMIKFGFILLIHVISTKSQVETLQNSLDETHVKSALNVSHNLKVHIPVEIIDVDSNYFNYMSKLFKWKPVIVDIAFIESTDSQSSGLSVPNEAHGDTVAANVTRPVPTQSQPQPWSNVANNGADEKFKDVPVEIIDVDPSSFNYLMGVYRWRPDQIQISSTEAATTSTTTTTKRPVPVDLSFHDKGFTDRRIFVLRPGQSSLPISINIVNGKLLPDPNKPITEAPSTSTTTATTTTMKRKGFGKLWDVPTGCREGEEFVGGQCLKPFSFKLTTPKPSHSRQPKRNKHRRV